MNNQIDHERAFNEAWNNLASIWDADGLIATAPPPKKYTGQKQESYAEGWLACQDYLILERVKHTAVDLADYTAARDYAK